MLESAACGTPAVSFAVGGVPEAVGHMETGYLARPQDAADLAEGIRLILSDHSLRERMGRQAAEIAKREYSMERQARQFKALYQSLIEPSHS